MQKLPVDKRDEPDFGRKVASTISLLAMYNTTLLKRLTESPSARWLPDQAWLKETLKWADLSKRQPSRRVAERKLRELFENLRLTLVPLDEETLSRIPPRSEEVLEFLALSSAVQSLLSWYLAVEWFQRVFPEEPPPWVQEAMTR